MNSGVGVSWWEAVRNKDLQFSLIHTFISNIHDAINNKGEGGVSMTLHRHTDVLSLDQVDLMGIDQPINGAVKT